MRTGLCRRVLFNLILFVFCFWDVDSTLCVNDVCVEWLQKRCTSCMMHKIFFLKNKPAFSAVFLHAARRSRNGSSCEAWRQKPPAAFSSHDRNVQTCEFDLETSLWPLAQLGNNALIDHSRCFKIVRMKVTTSINPLFVKNISLSTMHN